jgi:hypothetical protein
VTFRAETTMDNLICDQCGTTYYSAAAELMVERNERCDCGGALRLVGEDDEDEDRLRA